jgi:hypothetical protein
LAGRGPVASAQSVGIVGFRCAFEINLVVVYGNAVAKTKWLNLLRGVSVVLATLNNLSVRRSGELCCAHTRTSVPRNNHRRVLEDLCRRLTGVSARARRHW